MAAFEDLAWWIKQYRAKALRIVSLIKEIERELFTGIGKGALLADLVSTTICITRIHRAIFVC